MDFTPQLSTPRGRASAERGGTKFVLLLIFLAAVLGGLFALGYLPKAERNRMVAAASKADSEAALEVAVIRVARAPGKSELVLPGNVQAISETSIAGRGEGYIKKRLVDIGDKVEAGQLLAEIESPEVDQQLRQARASLQQSKSALAQTEAAVQQARANLTLAEVTTKRTQELVRSGVLSQQLGDEDRARLDARRADLLATEANVRAARDAIAVNEANVQRLVEMQSYEKVRAPFSGLITRRNAVLGDLVSASGNASVRELYRLVELSVMRVFVEVPQSHVAFIRPGLTCTVVVRELGELPFPGTITRTANALDASARTLRTEVQVKNPQGKLLPGMYSQVKFTLERNDPPLIIPDNSLVTNERGTQVVVVENGKTAKYRKVTLGRDFGTQMEVRTGLNEGDMLILNPTDEIRDGTAVRLLPQSR